MKTVARVARALEVAAVVVVLLLLVGQLLGQPVLLGFVRTGSMAPALAPNDGFVAVPSAVAGPPEPGDVVVYHAEEIQDGGLTTHRVVGQTERGYITKGDANAITDQASGEPPVRRSQVVAKVLQVSGVVVAIPALGAATAVIRNAVTNAQTTVAAALGADVLTGTTGLLYLVAIGAVGAAAVDSRLNDGKQQRTRERSRDRSALSDPRLLVGACALVLLVGLLLPMVVPAGTEQVEIISSQSASERPDVIQVGGSSTVTWRIGNPGLLPTVVYLEPGTGVGLGREVVILPPRSSAEVAVTLHAPETTGAYRRSITTHRYVAILPQPVIDALYRVHPWAPVVSVLGAVVGPFYFIGVWLVGTRRLRSRRTRDRPTGRLGTIWRWIK